jgi:hypothetical protein
MVKYSVKNGFWFKCYKINTITIFLLAYIFIYIQRGVRDRDRKPIVLAYRGVTPTTMSSAAQSLKQGKAQLVIMAIIV